MCQTADNTTVNSTTAKLLKTLMYLAKTSTKFWGEFNGGINSRSPQKLFKVFKPQRHSAINKSVMALSYATLHYTSHLCTAKQNGQESMRL